MDIRFHIVYYKIRKCEPFDSILFQDCFGSQVEVLIHFSFFLCVCACVCGGHVYASFPMCVSAHVPMGVQVQRCVFVCRRLRLTSGIFLGCSSIFLTEAVPQSNSELTDMAGLLRESLVSISTRQNCRLAACHAHLAFTWISRVQNFSPHSWMASDVIVEPSLHPMY